MKKTLCIMTALLMLMASFTLAEASDPADDKIIERFSDTWVADGLALEIWSEDNTIHCRGTLGDGGDESDSWEYATCRYDAASDSLQCADGTRTHEVYDAGTQENTDVVTVTGLTAVVFFQEGEDKLIWDDSEGMLKDFTLQRLEGVEMEDAAEAERFVGRWGCDRATIDITDQGDDSKPSAAPLQVSRGEIAGLLGASEKEQKAFDEAYLEQFGAVGMEATTVVEPKKFVIETENATIQVDPSRSDLVEMKRIDGRRFILIAVEGEASVNGIEVNIP